MDLAGTKYEHNFMQMVDATLMQDADCWEAAFGEVTALNPIHHNSAGTSSAALPRDTAPVHHTNLHSPYFAIQRLRGGDRARCEEAQRLTDCLTSSEAQDRP